MSAIHVTRKSGMREQEGNFFSQLLFRYLPYWPLFLILMVLGAAGAFLYIRYTVPVYEATASIMIKDERKGADDSKVVESLNLFGAKKIVENEIEMIRSRTLLKDVAINLKLYAPIYEAGNVNTIPAYTKSPVELELRHPDSLEELVEKIYFNFDEKRNLVQMEGREYPLGEWVNSPWGVLRFVRNPHYSAPSQQKQLFVALAPLRFVTAYLEKQLTVSPSSKQSTVIVIKIKDPVPIRGKLILSELIELYDRASVTDKNQLAVKTLRTVQERLEKMAKDLDSVDRQIEEYRTANNLVDIGVQGQQFLASVGTSDQQVSEIDGQLSVIRELEAYLQNPSSSGLPSTIGLQDPMLAGLITRLAEAQSRYEALRQTTGANNPMVLTLREEIERLRANVRENISSQKDNLQARRRSLASTTGKYSSMLRSMPEKERRLVEISRERAIMDAHYQALLQKKEETELSLEATVSDSRVVDEPEATVLPVSPNTMFVYLIAVFGSAGIGVLVIAAREGLNRTILFRHEIEGYTVVPVIGEVVQDNSGEQIVISMDRRDFIAEQFRQIRTSLSYLGISAKKKKILVTSSIPGEGKSFISANLAISLALTDKKVVLLEMDLRKPKLSEVFGTRSTNPGISNFLIGEKEADEIIKRTDVNPNLFIISAGPIPPNPSELILNGRVQELLAYLENAFDYIVIDSAPVSPVTDSYLLSQHSDATLYVVRHGYTPRSFLQHLDETNRVRGLKNLAIIFNGIKPRGMVKAGYGSGYGYGYGVGYGDDAGQSKSRKGRSMFGKAYK